MNEQTPRILIIGGDASGVGKTTVTLGLLRIFLEDGFDVRSFKVGPDYIDPAYHEDITGIPAVNLDPWMTSDEQVRETVARYGTGADIIVIEGVMGMFDGKQVPSGSIRSSTADVARILDAPVFAVIDASRRSTTTGAVAHGLQTYDNHIELGGVIANRVAGSEHAETVRSSVEARDSLTVAGILPENPDIQLPERHLGLVSVEENPLSPTYLESLSSYLREHLDTNLIRSHCTDYHVETGISDARENRPSGPLRVGIARDRTFCFYYEENLRLLREAAGEVVFFRPLEDRKLPPDLDVLYFGGGFPEEFAPNLADQPSLKEDILEFQGKIIAECGGLMYLVETLIDADSTSHEMVGRIPGTIEMTDQLQGFGYREMKTDVPSPLGPPGTELRGHEFHYSRWKEGPPPDTRNLTTTTGTSRGFITRNVFASYVHFHLGSAPEVVRYVTGSTNEGER